MKIKNLIFLITSFLFLCNLKAADSTVTDPDPHRYQNEIDAFKGWDQKNSYPENAILFAGSSSIRMWQTHNAFPQYPVINRGFGGAHIPDVIYFYKDVILKYNPQMIIFYCGDNDIASNKPVEQVFQDYLELISNINKDFPDVKFVFISVKPSGSRWKYWDSMDTLNKKIEKYNQEFENLYYVDLSTPLLNSNGKPDNDLFLSDQLHLNEKGYKIWNSILSENLKSLFNDN
ncbi:MAG: GDSL-type esterase/lipase family protein [Calditrichaceae bacterium]